MPGGYQLLVGRGDAFGNRQVGLGGQRDARQVEQHVRRDTGA
jgi:hypothetical protein